MGRSLAQNINNIQMEMENQKNSNIFSVVEAAQLQSLHSNSFSAQIKVSLDPNQNISHRLILATHFIILAHLQHNTQSFGLCAARIDFDLKFQMLFADQKNPLSQKIGFTFFRDKHQPITFYSNNQQDLQCMRNCLIKCLNQRGFHTQFKALRKLGKGNFASVYQVSQFETGNRYAVKAFSKANVFSVQNGRQSLINQLAVMRELSHQCLNLISLEAVYQSDNSIYMILELLEGKTLSDVLKDKKQGFTVQEIRSIMRGLLKGLETMHSLGVMHRDLKPENIMFRYQNQLSSSCYEPVIIDFGLSTKCEKTPYLFFRCGTPGFVAPEIIKIQQNCYYSSACDLFSMGCIFHLIVTGQALFPGTRHDEVYKRNKILDFDIQEVIMNKIHPFALDLLERMIQSNPEERVTASDALNSCFFVSNSKISYGASEIENEYESSNICVEGESC